MHVLAHPRRHAAPAEETDERRCCQTDLDTVKAILRWKIIRKVALYMPASWIDLMVEWNADLYGMSAKSPRDRKCYYSTSSGAVWPMAKLYVDKLFHSQVRS